MVNQCHVDISPENIIVSDSVDKKVIIPWINISKVSVFTIDAFIPSDFRAMLVEFGKEQSIQLDEDMPGWNALTEALEVYLNGAMASNEWQLKIFKPQQTPIVIYEGKDAIDRTN